MAIPFTRLRYRCLLPRAGTAAELGYIGRRRIIDRRLDLQLDFTELADDLVYEDLSLPDAAPPEFCDIETFANENDAAEMRHVRGSLDDRERSPQIGIAIVHALPPDWEITLDEAVELTGRVVKIARGEYRVGVHVAIHDPALRLPGAVNRHAHAFLSRREIRPDGFERTKIRNQTARLGSSGGSSYVAEGIHWPSTSRAIQQSFFDELATDLIVDPIAPFPEVHWGLSTYRDPSGRVKFFRSYLKDRNIAAIHGQPGELLNSILRGRSTVKTAEVRRFVEKFLDRDADRDAAMDRILADAGIVTLADTPGPGKPRYVTTARVNNMIEYAVELVDRARDGATTIHAVVGNDHAAVVAAIGNKLREHALDFSGNDLLIVGDRLSDCDATARALAHAQPRAASIKSALKSTPSDDRLGPSKRPVFPANGLIIVPRAEDIGDQTLATLFEVAQKTETTILLGKDLSRSTGVVANRLAAYAVDRLAARPPMRADFAAAEGLLRAGMITAAVKTLAPLLSFEQPGKSRDESKRFDHIVCSDPRTVAGADVHLKGLFARSHPNDMHFVADLIGGPIELWPGQPIVFTRTDYSARPAKIREGQVATISQIDPDSRTIRLAFSGGKELSIDVRIFPWLRSAFALSIREARQLATPSKLLIEISDTRHAWAALLLASTQTQPPKVTIDPRVARNVEALIIAVSRSLPGSLPTDLTARPDWNAEESTILSEVAAEFAFEPLPEPPKPKRPKRAAFAPRIMVSSEVRTLLASDRDAILGFDLLCERLHPDNPDREAVAKRVVDACGRHSLTAELIEMLIKPTSSSAARKPNSDEDFDTPQELKFRSPRYWDANEIWTLKANLYAVTSRWSDLYLGSSLPIGENFPALK